MNIENLKSILDKAIENLYNNDFHLIEHNLSEQSISHRLAIYIEKYLGDSSLSVDCEYNGDLQNEDNSFRKNIAILSTELKKLKQNHFESELTSRYVFPDVIIHKRGTSEQNYLIIELKKKYVGRSLNGDFDRLKLTHFTSEKNGNHLKYKLGAFVEISTKTQEKEFIIEYYMDGNKL